MNDGAGTLRSVLIIANPVSRRGRGFRTAAAVAEVLERAGIAVRVHRTAEPGDAERVAREASKATRDRPDCIVACGGDGTVQEVVNGIVNQGGAAGDGRPFLGIAPAGRCNDFARAFHLPTEPRAIAEVLLRGQPKAVDLGRVNGRLFCTVATIGIDAEVTSYVESMNLPLTGTPAYLYGALCVLCRYQPPSLRIHGDFGLIERPLFLASSANTSSYGGAIPIAPEASPTDGKLDLCIIDEVSIWRALTLIPSVLRSKHLRRPEVRFFKTTRVEIDACRPLELWADGERVGSIPAVIEVIPGAIELVLPADRDT